MGTPPLLWRLNPRKRWSLARRAKFRTIKEFKRYQNTYQDILRTIHAMMTFHQYDRLRQVPDGSGTMWGLATMGFVYVTAEWVAHHVETCHITLYESINAFQQLKRLLTQCTISFIDFKIRCWSRKDDPTCRILETVFARDWGAFHVTIFSALPQWPSFISSNFLKHSSYLWSHSLIPSV